MSALSHLQELLRNATNLAEVARECNIPRRTLARIRDGENDTSLSLAERIYHAAIKHQPASAKDSAAADA